MNKKTAKPNDENLRQKAEGLLKNNKTKINTSLSESDNLKLIHELKVHQIELELQNEELHRAKEQAEKATKKYTELYDFAPIGYFTLNRNNEITELNFAAAKMLGKERSYLQNKHFFAFVSNDSKKVFNDFIKNVFESFITESCEVTLIPTNNLSAYIYLTGIALENENRCLLTAVDISQRKQMERELIEAKEQALENDRLKTSFLQNISHEIRTPMNAIKGFARLLVKNYDNKAKLQKFTQIINQRCDDLLNIINDILDIARIESGQLPLHMGECELNDLFAELTLQIKEYQQSLNKQHIRFSLQDHYKASGDVIITDKVKLKQIFVNLLTNAFKFTNTGTVEGGCKFENNKHVFYVSDTGIGIPSDKQKEVFERFVQLPQTNNTGIGGTGLGLSITEGLVSLLGGEIVLVSEPGKGSTFSFTFPYKAVQLSPKKSLVTEETNNYKFSNKTILLVEDEASNVELIKEFLDDTGVNILLAETGYEAIQMASLHPVDLVLMDIQLPDIDGYQAAKQIKLSNPDLGIISQTAYASNYDKQKALDAGFIDYISKPIEVDFLLSMLNKYLS